MSTMDNPWSCPHGRPTIRHLIDLDQIPLLKSKLQKKKAKSDVPTPLQPYKEDSEKDSD